MAVECGYNMTLVTERSRRTLNGLFPNWPPGAPSDEVGLLFWFRILARPFPEFSAKLNAWVTWLAAQWLMDRSFGQPRCRWRSSCFLDGDTAGQGHSWARL